MGTVDRTLYREDVNRDRYTVVDGGIPRANVYQDGYSWFNGFDGRTAIAYRTTAGGGLVVLHQEGDEIQTEGTLDYTEAYRSAMQYAYGIVV